MPEDPTLAAAEAEHRRLAGPPLHPDVLTFVTSGDDRLGTWELRDGPHPMPQQADTVRYELILRRSDRGGTILSGTGPSLSTLGKAGLVGTAAHQDKSDHIGNLEVRCAASVAAVRVYFRDGTNLDVPTVLSPSTGQRWAVCPLDSDGIAIRIDLLDNRGTELHTELVHDPRITPVPD